uniref:Ig-like domain-containing protein n=1 Tax=Marmota marmota marmota TaxID=9994 RepID=A0A8C6EU25_MARMA
MRRGLGALLGLLWVQLCWVRGQQVEQSPSALRIQEGTSTTLRCNFSTNIYSVQWFLQNPGGSLRSLFFLTSGTKQEERLNATMNSKDKSIQLVISASQLGDSEVYFCALRDGTVGGLLEGGAQKPRVCLSHPPAGGTKAGSGHPRQEVARAVSAHVWGWRENTHSEETLSRFIDHIRIITKQTSRIPESLD